MEANYHFAVLAGRRKTPLFGLEDGLASQPATDAKFTMTPSARQCFQQSVASEHAACSLGLMPRSFSRIAWLGRRLHARAQQVLVYCFRERKCGTFMPLSCVRRESRIAVVWTWFSAVFSAISSGPFRVLFTGRFVLWVVDCG